MSNIEETNHGLIETSTGRNIESPLDFSGKKIILHLCADIGSDSRPYQLDDDYHVITVGSDVGVENFIPQPNVYGVIANPVCTEFSFAKYANNLGEGNHDKAMEMVNHCLRIIKGCKPSFWVIENPATGRLKEFLGSPRFTYQPWEFGSPWTKRTALWGDFKIPKKLYKNWGDVPKIAELYTRPNRPKPSLAFLNKSAIQFMPEFEWWSSKILDNAGLRSLCSQGFARAFKEIN